MSQTLENSMPNAASETSSEISQAPDNGIKSPARRHFMALGTALGGAAFAGALFSPARADLVAAVGKIFYLDPIVLNFALELEELESDFFSRVTTSSGFGALDERQQNIFYTIASQDKAHFEKISSIRDLRGDTGARRNQASSLGRPKFFRYGPLGNKDEVLGAALDLKENALFAYHGAVGLIKDASLLSVAASIAGVEGRHVSALRESMGLDPVPAPFEGALEAQVSGRKLARYGFVGGASK
ncbi:Ferritin-like domain-containing protein [Abditibacterium utsteinense]|uniref:Ferritin-like domain-containing protein n=1 Tax=Abditibacterium utsteinense TaxID=1960156 RepID=A0A2S8STW5_9BACT|nr:ferritin-like domain-containing protein [Abditibacterium utsteinense]PQV64245.1 Ferritin-like domain-containing protein [Abditibacterium utsteinense]